MDPLSAAGLGIGVVSLTFELFSACIKGMLSIPTFMEEALIYYRV